MKITKQHLYKKEKEICQYYQITSSDYLPDGKNFIVGENDRKTAFLTAGGTSAETSKGHKDFVLRSTFALICP